MDFLTVKAQNVSEGRELAMQGFEKWLVETKGYTLSVRLCKKCDRLCGARHRKGGCVEYYRDAEHAELEVADYFVLFYFRDNSFCRLDMGTNRGFDLEKAWNEYVKDSKAI